MAFVDLHALEEDYGLIYAVFEICLTALSCDSSSLFKQSAGQSGMVFVQLPRNAMTKGWLSRLFG